MLKDGQSIFKLDVCCVYWQNITAKASAGNEARIKIALKRHWGKAEHKTPPSLVYLLLLATSFRVDFLGVEPQSGSGERPESGVNY